MKSVLLIAIVTVAMIGMIVPSAFANHASSGDSSNYNVDHGLQMLTWSVNVAPPSIYQPAESIVLEMEGTFNLINTDRNHFIKFHIKNPDGVEVKTLPTYFRDGEFYTANLLIFNDFGIHSVEWSYTGTSETISIPKGFLGTFEVVDYSADTTPPVVSVPNDFTFTTTDINGNGLVTIPQLSFDTAGFPPTATDDVDGNVDAFCSGTNSYTTWDHWAGWGGWIYEAYPFESTPVTCTATDSSGNVGTASFTITVTEASADTTPPVITISELTTDQYGNKNLELSMSGTTNFPTGSWTVTATDNVGVADSACWANIGGMDDPGDPWISSSQSYDFSKITNNPSGQKFPIGPTDISCAAYDAAGNRSESNFRVVVTHDDPTGFVQYIDKPSSFGNTPDSTTKIFYSAGSAQGLHLLKPIADLLTASNTQGMLARQAEWTLLDGAITIKDDPIQSWNPGGSFYARMSGDGYDREIAKPLATMLTDANMAGMLERNNPDRSWTSGSHTITISESSGNFAAMVKVCSPSGGGTSCQENHVLKPFADMLNESNLNQAMFERSNMKILDAGGPAASAPQSSSSADTTPPSQSYTVLVNEMRGSIAANDPGGCASFNPQTCYTPSDITINVGDSVTWVNNDPTNNWYTLMGNWGGLASSSGDNACDGPGKLNSDMCGVSGNDRTNWTHTFDTVGTFNYHDWVYQNSSQRPEGVVNVVASGAPSPVTPTPSTPTPSTPTPSTPTPSTNSTSTNSTSTNSTSTTPAATPTTPAATPTTPAATPTTPAATPTTPAATPTVPVTPSTNKITVQTNRETYSQGNPIVLFGKVSTVIDNDLISLKISKDGSIIDTQSFKPTSKGEYTKLVISSGNLWDSTGNYRVDASYDGATSTSNFYFTSSITSTNSTLTNSTSTTNQNIVTNEIQIDSSKDLKISLNKENIKVGETITIRALLDSIVSEQNVAVSVIDPNGKNVVSRTITVEKSDQSSLQFKLVDNAISGTYIVKITSLMNGQTISDSAQFTVVSSNSGVKIVSIEPTDQQGNTISTFAKNKMGFVKVVLSAENPINSLVTVNLFDSEFTSLGVGSFKTQLSGDHEIILSFFIPEFTTIGNGEIYTNVFSEWPSVGGIPLTGESSSKVILK